MPNLDEAMLCCCRDLKTSNILLSGEGIAKIADVGLAKMVEEQQSLDTTAGEQGSVLTVHAADLDTWSTYWKC